MKNFNLDWARRKTSWPLGNRPAPFAGAWPTRLYWNLADEFYLGKPAPQQVERFFSALTSHAKEFIKNPKLACFLAEFDRHGCVYVLDRDGGRGGQLFQFYHHWTEVSPLASHLRLKLTPKRIGGWTIYSPYSTLKKEFVEEWRQFAEDLLARRLPPSKPKSVPAKASYQTITFTNGSNLTLDSVSEAGEVFRSVTPGDAEPPVVTTTPQVRRNPWIPSTSVTYRTFADRLADRERIRRRGQ